MRTAPDQPNVYCSHSHASIYERRRRRCPVCSRRPGDARLPHSASARAPLHVSCGVCTDTRSTPCLGRCLHGCPAGGRSGPGQCSILHSLWGTIHIQYPRPSRPPLQTMYPGPAATPDRSGSQKKKMSVPMCSFTSRWSGSQNMVNMLGVLKLDASEPESGGVQSRTIRSLHVACMRLDGQPR